MRRFLIDTDTGSDDAVALVMALREKSLRVEAVTAAAGNVSLADALRNAAASIAAAGTYRPPLFAGADRPLLRDPFRATDVHGEGGMSGMELAAPERVEPTHAALAIIDYARRFPGELELLTLGPLTNLALALALDRGIAGLFKSVTMMAGTGLGPGNVSAAAEFNVFADAEAAAVALGAGLAPVLIGWDACLGPSLLGDADVAAWLDSGDPAAAFCERATRSIRAFYRDRFGVDGFGLADPAAAAVAFAPELAADGFDAFVAVETASPASYGQLIMDRRYGVRPNARVVTRLDSGAYRAYLNRLASGA
jgi:purine nucleosidase